jgi:hypothetical protein
VSKKGKDQQFLKRDNEGPGPKCSECGQVVASPAALTRHQTQKHGLGKPASKD